MAAEEQQLAEERRPAERPRGLLLLLQAMPPGAMEYRGLREQPEAGAQPVVGAVRRRRQPRQHLRRGFPPMLAQVPQVPQEGLEGLERNVRCLRPRLGHQRPLLRQQMSQRLPVEERVRSQRRRMQKESKRRKPLQRTCARSPSPRLWRRVASATGLPRYIEQRLTVGPHRILR